MDLVAQDIRNAGQRGRGESPSWRRPSRVYLGFNTMPGNLVLVSRQKHPVRSFGLQAFLKSLARIMIRPWTDAFPMSIGHLIAQGNG